MEYGKFTDEQEATIRESLVAALEAYSKKNKWHITKEAFDVIFNPEEGDDPKSFPAKFNIQVYAAPEDRLNHYMAGAVNGCCMDFCRDMKSMAGAETGTAKADVLYISAQNLGDLAKFLNKINAGLGTGVQIDVATFQKGKAV